MKLKKNEKSFKGRIVVVRSTKQFVGIKVGGF